MDVLNEKRCKTSARSTGNPGFFREFFIEKFITVNAQGNFQPEGLGGGKGYRGPNSTKCCVASTLRREAPLREPGVPPSFVALYYKSVNQSSYGRVV